MAGADPLVMTLPRGIHSGVASGVLQSMVCGNGVFSGSLIFVLQVSVMAPVGIRFRRGAPDRTDGRCRSRPAPRTAKTSPATRATTNTTRRTSTATSADWFDCHTGTPSHFRSFPVTVAEHENGSAPNTRSADVRAQAARALGRIPRTCPARARVVSRASGRFDAVAPRGGHPVGQLDQPRAVSCRSNRSFTYGTLIEEETPSRMSGPPSAIRHCGLRHRLGGANRFQSWGGH